MKDSIAVRGMLWTSGLKCRRGIRADHDAPVVADLRSAGAIPLAITNVCELLMWWHASNKLYGTTLNPYDMKKIPGGSSGGEAALLSSAASLIGLGSDFAGSVRTPSFMCGVFGHKPSPFLISSWEGMYPQCTIEFAPLFTYGPMTRYASDLLPMLK